MLPVWLKRAGVCSTIAVNSVDAATITGQRTAERIHRNELWRRAKHGTGFSGSYRGGQIDDGGNATNFESRLQHGIGGKRARGDAISKGRC